jgi:hypothetical protein
MTLAQRVLELFLARPTGVNQVEWLANELLALAAESPFLSLRLVPDETGTGLRFEAIDPSATISSEDSTALRLFRTVLARLAKMAEVESGVEFNPYGGTVHFDRQGPQGPVRIDAEFGNTSGAQHLTLRRAARLAAVSQTRQEGLAD